MPVPAKPEEPPKVKETAPKILTFDKPPVQPPPPIVIDEKPKVPVL